MALFTRLPRETLWKVVNAESERARRRAVDQGAADTASSLRRRGSRREGGSGYNAAKFGAHAVTRSLRLELLGEDVRVTEVLPGAMRTEFGLVRFEGDEERAEAAYKWIAPLTAERVWWIVTLPPHVNVDRIDVRPVRQGGAAVFARDFWLSAVSLQLPAGTK